MSYLEHGEGARPVEPEERPRGPETLNVFELQGEVARFGWRALRELRYVGGFVGESLRQASIIATGSVAVIMFISFLAGGSCGLESTALARSFGVDPIAGGFSTWCTLREVVPFVFGYILAAKVGCGMVAEIGSMRAHEEIDALEAMGVRPLAYLVCTRMVGAAIVLPIAYTLAIAASYLAAFLMSVKRFGDVSQGTWERFFYYFQDEFDIFYSLTKGLAIAAFVILTALFFGFTVKGGPVEVGKATARSMGVNIIGVTVISMVGTLIFWGANPRIPIG